MSHKLRMKERDGVEGKGKGDGCGVVKCTLASLVITIIIIY